MTRYYLCQNTKGSSNTFALIRSFIWKHYCQTCNSDQLVNTLEILNYCCGSVLAKMQYSTMTMFINTSIDKRWKHYSFKLHKILSLAIMPGSLPLRFFHLHEAERKPEGDTITPVMRKFKHYASLTLGKGFRFLHPRNVTLSEFNCVFRNTGMVTTWNSSR